MRIVVFGATGDIGRRVVTEALRRGHDVVGVVRDPAAVADANLGVRLVKGDASSADDVAAAVRGADAVVSAIVPRQDESGLPAPPLATNARALIAGLRRAGVRRVLDVGGASTFAVGPGSVLADEPDFPEVYEGEAQEAIAALAVWHSEGEGLDWTYMSPAVEIGPGARTGSYRMTDDRVLFDAEGRSFISYEDYAVAVLDELEHPRHVGRRFGVAY